VRVSIELSAGEVNEEVGEEKRAGRSVSPRVGTSRPVLPFKKRVDCRAERGGRQGKMSGGNVRTIIHRLSSPLNVRPLDCSGQRWVRWAIPLQASDLLAPCTRHGENQLRYLFGLVQLDEVLGARDQEKLGPREELVKRPSDTAV